jgi:hypothetical protein
MAVGVKKRELKEKVDAYTSLIIIVGAAIWVICIGILID